MIWSKNIIDDYIFCIISYCANWLTVFRQMNWPAENKCTQDIPRGLMPTATVIVSDMQVIS